MIRGLPRHGRVRDVCETVKVKVSADEQRVQRTDGERCGKCVRKWARATKPGRREEAFAKGPPDVVQVATDDDRRPLVQPAKRMTREEPLQLLLTLGAQEP